MAVIFRMAKQWQIQLACWLKSRVFPICFVFWVCAFFHFAFFVGGGCNSYLHLPIPRGPGLEASQLMAG